MRGIMDAEVIFMPNISLYDRILGSLIGGAAGDALGYAIEFSSEGTIFGRYGESGITEYKIDYDTGKAIISDDTQMTLFTADAVIESVKSGRPLRETAAESYLCWLETQTGRTAKVTRRSPLTDIPALRVRRAPGNTCLSSLFSYIKRVDFIDDPVNNSKGCGSVMRVAPVALGLRPGKNWKGTLEELDFECAQAGAITHGHPLGYRTCALMNHIIALCLSDNGKTLRQIVEEANAATARLFSGDGYTEKLYRLIETAIELSGNNDTDLNNIHALGEGWVAEEALAIAVYCALRHEDNFDAALIASVNHKGDSDSTGAVMGNLLGAYLGIGAIGEKWTKDLELADVITDLAGQLGKL